MTPHRLLTIPFSHFCEKARWGLDRAGVAYVEEAYLPGRHVGPARRAGGQTVPILVGADVTLLASTPILHHAEAACPGAIWPAADEARRDAEALVNVLDAGLGVAARVLAYTWLVPAPRAFVATAARTLPAVERALLRMTLPLLRGFVLRRYRAGEGAVEDALAVVDDAFAQVASRLRGRPDGAWLVGDAMTGADLTFAALASPLLLPPEHPVYDDGEDLGLLPPAMRAVVLRLRSHPAGRHALRTYAERDVCMARTHGEASARLVPW